MSDFFSRRKPETLAIIIAFAGVLLMLALFLTDLIITRHRDLNTGEQRLRHFSLMMAEHTSRSFEAADSLLRDIATDLSRSRNNWQTWSESQGWDYVAHRHSAAMPQIRDIAVFDRNGDQRFLSTQFPPSKINVSDRPYFIALQRGSPASSYGPLVARNTGRYTFVLARRLTAFDGDFAGIAVITIDPSYLQDFCWPARISDEFEAILTNADGKVIASCRPTDQSQQSHLLGQTAIDSLFANKIPTPLPADGIRKVGDLWVSAAAVPGFPELRILSSLPESALLDNWRMRLIELSALGLLVTATLLFGALLIRRQVRKMSAMTNELESARRHLEARVMEATEALAGQRDNAERENTAKSRFLAAASHDLRQPMHALALFAADLQRQVRKQNIHEFPRLAEQIAASTNALSERLDALLDISRIDVSGITADKHPFPVAPLFARLEQAFRRTAQERGIRLRFHAGKHWIETDPGLLERMLGNLIANALRYTPSGGCVLVASRRRKQHIDLEVRDSGIGIPQEHQDSVFREFYQVGNAAREEAQGLGLGLSIVERLARALEIPIRLRSRMGEGSTFVLQVPAVIASTSSLAAMSEPAPGLAGKILGVGESDELLECLRLAATWGYEVRRESPAQLPDLPDHTLLICDAAQLEKLLSPHITDTPLVVLSPDIKAPMPAGGHALQTPVRPAKLRALLAQLQKIRSKSIP